MLSTKKQASHETEIALNMSQYERRIDNHEPDPPQPPPYNENVGAEVPFQRNSVLSLTTSLSSNDDVVKPELPEFLQNMGPGISPLKENPPVTLSWLNVRAQAPSKQGTLKRTINGYLGKEVKGPKDLLKGVSGLVKAGEMCAIMGASGAGKTTLMNILTHRRMGTLKVNADVRINGRKMKRDISGVSGFVQQEELFIGSMTVREHLRFHSMLRLGEEFTKDERAQRVDEVIHFLNLTKSENTLIGIPGMTKGLSGGEKRRLTFATEILSDPPLLLCDEPTSGLDSSMAFILVQAMRKLADLGRTIICTIHQPSSEIFYLFDRLYLLAEGRLAYFGSLEKAPAFFRKFELEIPSNYNPADFYIQQLAIYPRTREANLAQIERICSTYDKSSQNTHYMSELLPLHSDSGEEKRDHLHVRLFNRFNPNNANESNPARGVDVQAQKTSRYKTSFWVQFRWLTWRNFINVLKNPFEIRLRVFLAIFVGTLVGLLYIRLKYDQTAVQNMNSLVFLILINTSFANVFSVTTAYPKEYPIFYKEHDDAVYRVTPYYLSKFVTEIPIFVISTLIQVSITYWMTNLYATAKRFFILVGIIILTSLTSVGLGTLLSVISDTPEQAQALQIPILLPLMVFGGFFLNNQSGQKWLLWIKYISWFYYGNEALVINQWQDVTNLTCAGVDPGLPCYHTGKDIIALLDFKESHFGRDIGLIIVLWLSLRIVSFIILAVKAKRHK